MNAMELWAGAECTVARIGDAYRDQIALTGHDARLDDIDRMASLGVQAIRFPVLWERVAPNGIASADWSWTDTRLSRMRDLGIRPIIGLVHHGSGPPWTSLVKPSFVTGLCELADAVARRYSWVMDFTPVNEPLTTARFSGLYGHWYPHGRDDATFARALVNECMAVSAAMAAIRDVTPGARLVQTEDIGKTFSTPHLVYQRDFDNTRRWLSLDLLTGRVDAHHPMRGYLERAGVPASELDGFVTRPCAPDVVGANYYITSDRFLDERTERYPPSARGGNPQEAYADFEAARARDEGILGHHALLHEIWERYKLPVALTEVHIGSTHEEQARWIVEAWEGATQAKDEGVDVRAFTLWAVFGSVDWNSLLTRHRGAYEPGAYDARGPAPRPTIVKTVVRELFTRGGVAHPAVWLSGLVEAS